jgi:hypothetical protein
MGTSTGRAAEGTETLSLDDLALRMTAYRERATTARRLAEAISDKRATTGLLAHAEDFEKKAEEIAAQIVLLAHRQNDDSCLDADSSAAPEPPTPQKRR